MIRCIAWAGVVAAFLGAGPGTLAAPQEAPAPRRIPAVLKYGGDRSFAPYEFLDKGEPRGFQVDLVRAIAREMGVRVEVRLDDWSHVREGLTTGEFDLACMSDHEARRLVFDFSDPFAVKGSEIFVRRGDPPIRHLYETAGKTTIVEKGSVAVDELARQGIAATIVPVPTELDAIQLLASGAHDCAIVTSVGGRRAIDLLPATNVVASSASILRLPLCFAARRGNVELVDWVNEGLERVKLSGEYNTIYAKWFPPPAPIWTMERAVRLAFWVGAPLLAAVAVLAILSSVLKRKVDERTAHLTRELEQRRKAEAERERALDQLRLAVKTAHLIVFQQDLDLRYEWVYYAHPRIPPGSLEGKTDDEVLPPDVHDYVVERKRAVLRTGKPDSFEVDTLVSSGFVFHVMVEPRLDSGGRVCGLTAAAIDISALKRAEMERLELERRIQQAEKLETLGLLAGGIAHDFNNLLAGILGNAALASGDVKPESTAAEKLAAIERTARTASDLTQQLLSFVGRGRVELGPVDVGAAAKEIVTVLEGAVPKHVLLVCEDPPRLPPVLGNAVEIRQVIMNLVKNGADAVGNRTGHVTVRCDVVHADRAFLADAAVGSDVPEGEYVRVEVKDDGAGMDRETLARSLELFFTKKPGGRGIGLAVVVGAIQRHRGALFVKSTPRVGTTFQALFPVANREAEEVARGSADPGSPRRLGASKRVLVVDDHRTVRDVICETLTRAGCDVDSAGSGAEALVKFKEAVETAPFDGVVLDLTLPDAYGLDVFDGIRRVDSGAHVILTSGHDEHGARARTARDPHAAFLAKPFTPADLVRALDELLGVRRA